MSVVLIVKGIEINQFLKTRKVQMITIGYRKPFYQKSFDSNDPQCRLLVKSYMRSLGFEFADNKDKYGIDLVSPTGDSIEIERRQIWDRGDFPYDTVHIPGRKARMFYSTKTHYVVVNKSFDRIGICRGSELMKHKDSIAAIPNNAVRDGTECFFNIPKSSFKWIKIPSDVLTSIQGLVNTSGSVTSQ